MRVVALAASTSRRSINRALIGYVADLVGSGLIPGATVEVLDLADYEMPIYSVDRQVDDGTPPQARRFLDDLTGGDAIVVSFAEHNATYTAAFKNVFDWASRLDRAVYRDKPVVMLATSPGARGGANVLDLATRTAPFFGAELRASLSIPMFGDVFDLDRGVVVAPEVDAELRSALQTLGT